MNDRYDPYGQPYGYDEYGRPLYPAADQPPSDQQDYGAGTGPQPPAWETGRPAWDGYQGGYDAYAGSGGHGGYGYGDAYAGQGVPETGAQQPATGTFDYSTGYQQAAPETTAPGHAAGYDPGYGAEAGTAEQPPAPAAPGAPAEISGPDPAAAAVPQQRRPPDDDYRTEQFSFVEEQNDDSEDVIDWLKFSESRTERREEAKRRGRGRLRLLIIALVVLVLGGTALLWATGRLPGLGGPGEDDAAAAPEVRDVIVVHLRQTDSDETATALLVANETDGTGTTLLLPNELAVTPDGGATTLGQAVTEEAAGSVRDSLGTLLGADIKGTWRLDTPYLEILVDLVGGITVDTDAEVAGEEEGAPLVALGEDVPLDGRAAIAYASHRGEDEGQDAQLARFGQVMHAVLMKLPSEEEAAVRVVESLTQITDPSLTEDDLGISLARLAGYAQDGAHTTEPLPVEADGTISDATAEGLVTDVLGGTVRNTEAGAVPRIGIRDATGGDEAHLETARIALVNGGFTVADSRRVGEPAGESGVTYADEAHLETAREVAATLGLPEESVTQGEAAGNADVTIVLGEDYEP
ncbi:LCP family protein [Streptomyces marincola]|uniref:LCP family protein n=1 Tax=Streptomyces marincola TaxID=2878388 RepID=UPI001CF16D68|nr:LCP family protein [Streptomyces marincola]